MRRKCPDLLDGLTTSLNSVSFCYMREKASIGISLLLSLIRKERSVTHCTLCVRPHVRNGYSFDYRLFHGFAAVCVHFALVLGLMGQAARAAYAAAYARHALYEVLGQTAMRHCSMPSQAIGLTSKSMFCSLSDWRTASDRPPLRANMRPK